MREFEDDLQYQVCLFRNHASDLGLFIVHYVLCRTLDSNHSIVSPPLYPQEDTIVLLVYISILCSLQPLLPLIRIGVGHLLCFLCCILVFLLYLHLYFYLHLVSCFPDSAITSVPSNETVCYKTLFNYTSWKQEPLPSCHIACLIQCLVG